MDKNSLLSCPPLVSILAPFLFLPTIIEKCPFNHNHRYVSIQSQLCVCLGVVRIHLKCCSFEWIAGNISASQQQLDRGTFFIDSWVVPGLYIKIPNHVLEISCTTWLRKCVTFWKRSTNLATD